MANRNLTNKIKSKMAFVSISILFTFFISNSNIIYFK